jgi:hypothetical protein
MIARMTDDDFETLRDEWLIEKVSEAFEGDHDNTLSRLEALGFRWVDDETDLEELEEKSAKPEGADQELLVGYLEGSVELSERVLRSYLAEKASDHPNYPLIRKHYKGGNQKLKDLLLFGLERDRTASDLLSDLAFFNEFSDARFELVQHYLWACEGEQNPDHFGQLVLNFHCHTVTTDFNALYQLSHKFAAGSEKGKIVREVVEALRSEP